MFTKYSKKKYFLTAIITRRKKNIQKIFSKHRIFSKHHDSNYRVLLLVKAILHGPTTWKPAQRNQRPSSTNPRARETTIIICSVVGPCLEQGDGCKRVEGCVQSAVCIWYTYARHSGRQHTAVFLLESLAATKILNRWSMVLSFDQTMQRRAPFALAS